MPINQRNRYKYGFTLVELMVVVAIVGILTSIALPAYQNYVREGRRTDGHVALSKIEVAQEKWRTSHTTYTGTLADVGVTGTSEGGHYTIAVSSATATGYVATATATATGSQASDTACATMTLTMASGTSTRSPATCWKK